MTAPPVVGVLHPGQMGAAIAAQIRRSGTRVLWCRAGRSAATAERAKSAGLEPVDNLADLLSNAEIVFSICPPEFAEDLADTVANQRYSGLYIDANAISPQRYARITDRLTAAGAKVLDGAIIGPPPTDGANGTRLYLAGDRPDIDRIAALFADSAVTAVPLDNTVGAASGLKMAYASYQKASRTLAAVAHALADRHGVTAHLLAEAQHATTSPLAEPDYLPSVAARAWRWEPEMREVADALTTENLPADLAIATGTVLTRWSADKDTWDLPLKAVLDRLRLGHGQDAV